MFNIFYRQILLITCGTDKFHRFTIYEKTFENYFYVLAICVGLVMGGIQSLSRSTFAKLMPETTKTASFFCYYDFTEKMAIAIGILSFGLIEELTHDYGGMKNSILSLIVFFVLGLIWLYSALRKQRQLQTVYS